jgi:hypothetical protein
VATAVLAALPAAFIGAGATDVTSIVDADARLRWRGLSASATAARDFRPDAFRWVGLGFAGTSAAVDLPLLAPALETDDDFRTGWVSRAVLDIRSAP